jgi:methionine aminopeptidase
MALHEACNLARNGRPINGIGKAIQSVAKQKGFRIIKKSVWAWSWKRST